MKQQYNVDPFAPANSATAYPTIQQAIDAAKQAGGGEVFLKAGTYIENLLLEPGVDLRGVEKNASCIIGNHRLISAGELAISNLLLTNFSDTLLTIDDTLPQESVKQSIQNRIQEQPSLAFQDREQDKQEDRQGQTREQSPEERAEYPEYKEEPQQEERQEEFPSQEENPPSEIEQPPGDEQVIPPPPPATPPAPQIADQVDPPKPLTVSRSDKPLRLTLNNCYLNVQGKQGIVLNAAQGTLFFNSSTLSSRQSALHLVAGTAVLQWSCVTAVYADAIRLDERATICCLYSDISALSGHVFHINSENASVSSWHGVYQANRASVFHFSADGTARSEYDVIQSAADNAYFATADDAYGTLNSAHLQTRASANQVDPQITLNNTVTSRLSRGTTLVQASMNVLMEGNSEYVASSGNLSFTLPLRSEIGDTLLLVLRGAPHWKISQGEGQQIRVQERSTSKGEQGGISATCQGDAIQLVCTEKDKLWEAYNVVGTLSIA